MFMRCVWKLAAAAGIALSPVAAGAQVAQVDPNDIGEYAPAGAGYQAPVPGAANPQGYPAPQVADPYGQQAYDPSIQDPNAAGADPQYQSDYVPIDGGPGSVTGQSADAGSQAAPPVVRETVPQRDIFTAAEDLFGRGAEGLGGLIERILKDQGEPIAYISGQEAGGAFIAGVRYGSGTMRHQVEGDRAVYWTGPSLGFDFGADASKVFVLVYNLEDGQDLFRAYPAAEGNAYIGGGFTASYLRRGNVVLIPVRLGVGLRLGVNAGYMRFSERNRWLPF